MDDYFSCSWSGFWYWLLSDTNTNDTSVGLTADKALAHQTQIFGAALIAIGFMSWFARDEPESKARRTILLALFLYFALGYISILLFALTGIPNIAAWFILAFHLLLALVYAYYLFLHRSP